MRPGFLLVATLICTPFPSIAQSGVAATYQLSGGYSYLSNSYNGIPGARQQLNGWDASAAFPAWHNLRFKVDVSGYNGTNLGATQRSYFILGGAQYEHKLFRETLFAHALFGDGGFNRNWGPGTHRGSTASFATVLGGGVDTPVSQHFAVRVEGDMQHTNLYLVGPVGDPEPIPTPGLPRFMGRLSTGLVWMPRPAPALAAVSSGEQRSAETPSELTTESLNSFGHYHVFGVTWWSYLNLAGIEYNRHTWGRFIRARMDYAGEILPVVILRQPSTTTIYGYPRTLEHTAIPGLAISPIGMRLLWRDGARWKPYYTIKAGVIGFTQKSLSNYASYENFSLQQDVGIQFQLTDKWDLRTGVGDFHFSNGFVVPNNPGIDEMMWVTGLTYRMGAKPIRF